MAELTPPPRECRAQVEEVRPRNSQILLRLSLAGMTAEKAVLVLKARGGSHAELRLPADDYGSGRFEVRIPLDALATACTAREWIWDLYLDRPDAQAGEEPLRVGRHWEEIAGKQKSFVYPAQHAAGVRIEPFFTVKDNLSITCARKPAP
ncbi:hypothetical protein [Streptomyces sp. NPDC001100]